MFTSNFFNWLHYSMTRDIQYDGAPYAIDIGLIDTSGNSYSFFNGGGNLGYMHECVLYNRVLLNELSAKLSQTNTTYSINDYEIDTPETATTTCTITQGLNANNELETVIGISMLSTTALHVRTIGLYHNFENSSRSTNPILLAIIPCDIELPANTTKSFTVNLLSHQLTAASN